MHLFVSAPWTPLLLFDEWLIKVSFLYCRCLAEVGLVPVEQQMKEMGIHKTEATDKDKRN